MTDFPQQTHLCSSELLNLLRKNLLLQTPMESTDSSTLCDICATLFADKPMLRCHKYEYHSVPNPISFQGGTLTVGCSEKGIMNCSISTCDCFYQMRSRLLQHITSHQGDLPRGSTPISLMIVQEPHRW